jgi:hypothetical protein
MIIEVLRQVHKLDIVGFNDPRIKTELEFTTAINEAPWNHRNEYVAFVNLDDRRKWNEFTLGQKNIMEDYRAIYDAAVYTWIVKKAILEQYEEIELKI